MGLEGKRVYLVEDNVDNIYVLLALFRKYGISTTVDWFAKGNARKLLKSLPLDLIVLDIMLPEGRSGYDMFQELRQLPELDSIPIIAISATEPSLGIAKTQELGFSGFISKPIDYELFPRQLEAIFEGKPIWNDDPDKTGTISKS